MSNQINKYRNSFLKEVEANVEEGEWVKMCMQCGVCAGSCPLGDAWEHTPQKIFNDRCVQLCFVLFWGAFILSAVLAYSKDVWPNYAQEMLTQAQIDVGSVANRADGSPRSTAFTASVNSATNPSMGSADPSSGRCTTRSSAFCLAL